MLEDRGIALEPLLAVISTVGTENVFLGVGTLSGRVQLLVPSRPAAVAVVAAEVTLPERSMLLVPAHRDEPASGALVIGGATTLKSAVGEVGPPASSHLWLPIVEWLMAGAIKNRTRYLGEERGSITVSYAPRSEPEDEARFAIAVKAAASKLKAPESWRKVYDEAGAGAEIGVTTECTTAGPCPRLALRFGRASWDRAIDLARALAGVARARGRGRHGHARLGARGRRTAGRRGHRGRGEPRPRGLARAWLKPELALLRNPCATLEPERSICMERRAACGGATAGSIDPAAPRATLTRARTSNRKGSPMAHLATHMTLDVLVATVADLEARVLELKRAANMLADTYSLELPYMDVGLTTAPSPRRREDSSADSQD